MNKCEFCVKTNRHSPAIGLEVPSNSPWEIISLVTPPKVSEHTISVLGVWIIPFPALLCPQIDMDLVLQYYPGKLIPHVPLKMKWVGQGQPAEGDIPVKLTGVHAPESFLLQCTPNKTTKG